MATKALRGRRLSLPLFAAMAIAALMASMVKAQVPAPPPPTPTPTPTPTTTTTTTAVPPPPPTPQAVGCTNAIGALLPCANYVTGTNGTATPACCNAFVAVIINNAATCLCQFLGTQNPLGLTVNQTQALALPAACNVTTPSLATQCAAIGVPLTPTSGLPVTPTSPGSSPVPIASAPTALPSPGPSTTAGTSITTPAPTAAGVPLGSPAIIPSSGNNLSGSSSNVGSSRPRTNSGVSISAVFAQSTGSLIVGVILAGALI